MSHQESQNVTIAYLHNVYLSPRKFYYQRGTNKYVKAMIDLGIVRVKEDSRQLIVTPRGKALLMNNLETIAA